MAVYAGETVRIVSRAQNWDGSVFGPSDGTVFVVVYAGDQEVFTQSMAWIPAEQRWECDWLEPDPDAYRIEVTAIGPGDSVSKDVRAVVLENPRGSVDKPVDRFIRGAF